MLYALLALCLFGTLLGLASLFKMHIMLLILCLIGIVVPLSGILGIFKNYQFTPKKEFLNKVYFYKGVVVDAIIVAVLLIIGQYSIQLFLSTVVK